VSGICNCGLPACCSQPAVAGGIIYADLWGELSTHQVPQALFAQSSPVREPLLQAFPFPSTGKGDTALALSGLLVYLQFMSEVGLPPSAVQFSSHRHFHKLSCLCLLGCAAAPASLHVCLQFTWEVGLPYSPVEFSSLHHSHQLPCSWLLGACPTPASTRGCPTFPACLFTVLGRILSFSTQCAQPSFQCVLIVLIAYYSVSLFFPGWRSVCPGGYAALAQACLWGYHGAVKLTWSASSQAIWAPATGGPRGPRRFSV
jgi:hypothetical protein